ncbi:MAG: hypothetical protein ACRBN8_02315 [Nannocystales bacterium]
MPGLQRVFGCSLAAALFGCSPSGEDAALRMPSPCPGSELVAPFCHRQLVAGDGQDLPYRNVYYKGGLLQPRDGVRPQFATRFAPQTFALFNPLDVRVPLLEVLGPDPGSPSLSSFHPAAGDLDGDGHDELVLSAADSGGLGWNLLVLNSQTLETKLVHPREGPPLLIVVLDLEGDGTSELVTLHGDRPRYSVLAWSMAADGLLEVGRAELTHEGELEGIVGDFDGDEFDDLALVRIGESDSSIEGEPLMSVLRGGAGLDVALPLEFFPQPGPSKSVVAADLDGDEDDEVVIFHDNASMTVVDWGREGLRERSPLSLALEPDPTHGVSVGVGKTRGRPDWLLFSDVRPLGASEDQEASIVYFPGLDDTTQLRELPLPLRVAGDYNDDGISDFAEVFTTGEVTRYVSLSGD